MHNPSYRSLTLTLPCVCYVAVSFPTFSVATEFKSSASRLSLQRYSREYHCFSGWCEPDCCCIQNFDLLKPVFQFRMISGSLICTLRINNHLRDLMPSPQAIRPSERMIQPVLHSKQLRICAWTSTGTHRASTSFLAWDVRRGFVRK